MECRNTGSAWYAARFAGPIHKIAVDAGFTCPNRDGTIGTQGCSFCLNEAFAPPYSDRTKSIGEQIDQGIEFGKHRGGKSGVYIAYFQSYSNTHADVEVLRARYNQALAHPRISGIIISTRPDCVDERKIDMIAELARDHYVAVEYGVESCEDSVLRAMRRGHDFQRAATAVEQTAQRGIRCGAHFIVGLPGQTDQQLIDQTATINQLPLDYIKFHQLQLFKGTPLAEEWTKNSNSFVFRTAEEYVWLMARIIARLRIDIAVERIASQVPPEYCITPQKWNIRSDALSQLIEQTMLEKGLKQGCMIGH